MAEHKAKPSQVQAICWKCGRKIHKDARLGWKHSPPPKAK